jgi:hypothetical protein
VSAREALARAQAELVRALSDGGPVPAGFDPERVRAAAESLLSKRRAQVRRVWPALVAVLGPGFSEVFTAWARDNPWRGLEPHPLVEGRRFAEALRAAGRLPPEAEDELLGFDLRWRLTAEGGVAARRGLSWKVGRVGNPRRWVLAVRLPGGRVRRWWLPSTD